MATFSHQIKVRGFHCDMFQHVNNARYLEFLEETRWEWLNRMTSFEFFEKHQMSFVVVSITIYYRWPSLLNDVLNITVETNHIGNRSASVKQVITRDGDSKLIAEAEVTFAMIDNRTGKSVPISDELKAFFEN